MRRLAQIGFFCTFALLAACGGQNNPSGNSQPKPTQPAVPQDIQDAGIGVLGTSAEVLAYGDLAKTGAQQVLVINRLHKAGLEAVNGALLTRLAIIEKDDDKWKEVFLCDEHLKNPKGFLGGTPTVSVPVWRLQFEQNTDQGLLLFLVPYDQQNTTSHPTPVEVRFNTKAGLYEALDRTYQHFQGENPMLEQPQRDLR
ncbi:MAG TPA: hypothetical protein VFO34_00475 [Candidatus Acidoferrales bacterium]|nr:hypothetical protein [Candidatus Acidoferrales bacterium]